MFELGLRLAAGWWSSRRRSPPWRPAQASTASRWLSSSVACAKPCSMPSRSSGGSRGRATRRRGPRCGRWRPTRRPSPSTRCSSCSYFRASVLFIARWVGPEAAGQFGAAFTFVQVLQVASGSLAAVLLPHFVRQAAGRAVAGRIDTVTRLLLTGIVPVAAGLSLLAPEIVGVVYASGSGRRAGPHRSSPGRRSSCSWDRSHGSLLIALDAERALFWISLVAAALSLAANTWLIPRFGFGRPAGSTVGTEALCRIDLPGAGAAADRRAAPRAPGVAGAPRDCGRGRRLHRLGLAARAARERDGGDAHARGHLAAAPGRPRRGRRTRRAGRGACRREPECGRAAATASAAVARVGRGRGGRRPRGRGRVDGVGGASGCPHRGRPGAAGDPGGVGPRLPVAGPRRLRVRGSRSTSMCRPRCASPRRSC